jgi:hypothetical protein
MKKTFLFLAIFLILSGHLFAEIYTLWGYDGRDYTKYLGKFSIPERFTHPEELPDTDAESIFNEAGSYGSKFQNTIWNETQQYGNKYQDFSISNPYGNHPPVIIDRERNIVGYLTSNKNFSENTDFGIAVSVAFRLQ